MGFPGIPKTRKLEGRSNNREAIAYYLETRHPKHYRLFNLTEEKYDSLLFDSSVGRLPRAFPQVSQYNFTGYSAPSLGLLFHILLDMETYLAKDPANVAVVHDYTGAGRALLVTAAFIRWEGWLASTHEALTMCLTRRNLPPDVMLPSQLRFLDYFECIMNGEFPSQAALRLSRITLSSLPPIEQGACCPVIEVAPAGIFDLGVQSAENRVELLSQGESDARHRQPRPSQRNHRV